MKANSGYTGGTWDQQPDTTADAVTGNLFYNYSFRRDSGHGGHDGHSGSTRYTLTYVSNGGTEYKAEWYDSGTTVKLNKTPVREGYPENERKRILYRRYYGNYRIDIRRG